MSIKAYFDKKLGKEALRISVVRKSSSNRGVRVKKCMYGILNPVDAARAEKKLILEAERELFVKESQGSNWESLVRDWEMAVRSGDIFVGSVTRSTMFDYLMALHKYTSDWSKLQVHEIDKARAWLLLDRVQREKSAASRKKLRTAIDAVINWGVLSGRIKKLGELPTSGFKCNHRDEEKLPEILTLEEIRTLLRTAKHMDHPWYPAWAVALLTGMRSGELFALEWSAVDFDSRILYVHKNWTNKNGFGSTKGRYWRTVPLGEQLLGFLKELKLKRGNESFVLKRFQAWEDGRQAEILRTFCVGMGLPSIKFHTLRACFATQLIKDKVAPAIVMKICGWKDLKTMMRYIRLAGIEVEGATESLKLLSEEETMGRVVNLFTNNNV